MEMSKMKRCAIMGIMQAPNLQQKEMIYESFEKLLKGCRIILFDQKCSNFGESFSNKKIGSCWIWGIGDYTQTWILGLNDKFIKVGKTIDLDLNILTYINKLMIGRKINIDIDDFIEYLNYLKREKFQIGVTTALMERVKTNIDLNIFAEMIQSYVKLDNIMYVNKNIEDINLSECDYKRVKELYDKSLEQIDDQIRQYDILCCCVMKAYLIKTFDKEQEKNKKVEKFIEYCLNEINCYSEKEIVVLSLYILDDYRTNRAFKKIKNNEDVIKNILNVTWDLYHIRLIEQIMLYDNLNKKDEIILSYFGTADKGLIDVMQINPAKAVVIMDNKIYIIHQINIENVCKKQELLDNAYNNDYLREKKIKNINFSEMRKQLEFQILSKVCN